MTTIRIDLPERFHDTLRALCATHRNTASGIVRAALVALANLSKPKLTALVAEHGEIRKPGPGRPAGAKGKKKKTSA